MGILKRTSKTECPILTDLGHGEFRDFESSVGWAKQAMIYRFTCPHCGSSNGKSDEDKLVHGTVVYDFYKCDDCGKSWKYAPNIELRNILAKSKCVDYLNERLG